MLSVSNQDLEKLQPVLAAGFPTPTIKISVYKNRRGRYKGIMLWCQADLGTCRIKPQFATEYNYKLISIDNAKIVIDEPGAF